MKKKLFIITILSFVINLSISGQNVTLGQENDFVFSDASFFCDGLARVKFGEKWGYINNLGSVIVKFDYNDARDFKNGYAAVKKGEKWGFIDKSGNIVVPIMYEETGSFNEGLASVKLNGKWGFVNSAGKIVVPIKYEPAGYMDSGDKHYFKNGYATVRLSSNRGKYGVLIDKNGNAKTPALKYATVDDYCDGLAQVMVVFVDDNGNRDAQFGYIDINGNEVIEPQYNLADNFVNGYAIVVKDGKSIIINKFGNVVVENPQYSRFLSEIHQGGMATFELKDSKKKVLVDMNGKELIPPIYDYIDIDERGSKDLIMVKNSNQKYGWIDINNKVVVPLKYDNSCSFNNGYAAVAVDEKWGVINKIGQIVLPLKYDIVGRVCFTDGYCMVKLNDNFGFVDKLGKSLKINLGKDESYEVGLKRESNWDGSATTKKYLNAAIDWFKNSALKGNEYASYKVGYYYFVGALGNRNFAEAVKWLEKSIRPNNNSNGNEYLLLGRCFKDGGYGITKDYTKAIKYYTEGANRNNVDCYNGLAYIMAHQKKYTEAMTNIDKAISLAPANPDYYDSKGEFYLMMGNDDEALKMWKKVMELNPNFLNDYPQGTELYNKLKAKGKIK